MSAFDLQTMKIKKRKKNTKTLKKRSEKKGTGHQYAQTPEKTPK